MQRLRILVPLLLLGLVAVVATDVQAQAAKPATRPATAKPAAAKPKPQPKKMNVGEVLTWKTPLAQVKPVGKPVDLAKREGRPLALLFWSTGATVAREELQALDAFVKKKKLARDMDVYAIGGFNPERQDAADLADMATILGVDTIPILVDPEFKLAKKIGATQFPDIVLFDKDGKLIVKGLRGLDHGRLRGSAGNCETLLKHVALNGTAEPVKRTSRFYPAERLKGRKIPDFELPYYHPDGYGKGKSAKLSDLMTGQRPAAIFIFSSTCKHCQTDVPQLVEFEKTHADAYDIIGITKIKNDRHRKVSTKYFKDQGIEFPILEDAGRVSELLKVTSTPTTLYVAPEGMVVKATYYQHRELEKDYLSYLPQLRGAPAPPPSPRKKGWHFPLKVKDAKGEVVDLARSEGKPTLIHFWATWCGPCVKELPEFMERVPELEKEGDVYLITVEDDPAAVAKYEKKSGLSLGSYLSPHEGLAENLDFSRSVPRTYVLDGNGNVTRLLRGSYDWKDPHRFANILNRMSK